MKNSKPASTQLRRPRNKMPTKIRALLTARGLLRAYKSRPLYQQNDYLGWIANAKRTETKQKRTNQMLEELERGNVYMKMKWRVKP